MSLKKADTFRKLKHPACWPPGDLHLHKKTRSGTKGLCHAKTSLRCECSKQVGSSMCHELYSLQNTKVCGSSFKNRVCNAGAIASLHDREHVQILCTHTCTSHTHTYTYNAIAPWVARTPDLEVNSLTL